MLNQAFPVAVFELTGRFGAVPSVIYYYHDHYLTQQASYIGFLLIDADDKRHVLGKRPLS